jgi:hypothetical protein
MMPSSARKGSWHFETLWTFFFSGHISPTITSDLLHDVESELQRDLLARGTRPPYLRSAELKYKLSDLEAALKTKPVCIRVTGYIQLDVHRAIGRDNLLRWFQATWSPVDGQMGRSAAYQEWSQKDPAYQRVNVSGEPAVASRGQGKKKVCVRPNPPNLNSLISPCDFYSNLDVTFFDSCPHLSLPDLWPSRQAAAAADRGSTAPSAQGRASPPPGDPAAAAPAAAGGARALPPAPPLPPPPAGAGGCAGSCAAKRPSQVREAPTRAACSSRMPACTRERSHLHRPLSVPPRRPRPAVVCHPRRPRPPHPAMPVAATVAAQRRRRARRILRGQLPWPRPPRPHACRTHLILRPPRRAPVHHHQHHHPVRAASPRISAFINDPVA